MHTLTHTHTEDFTVLLIKHIIQSLSFSNDNIGLALELTELTCKSITVHISNKFCIELHQCIVLKLCTLCTISIAVNFGEHLISYSSSNTQNSWYMHVG